MLACLYYVVNHVKCVKVRLVTTAFVVREFPLLHGQRLTMTIIIGYGKGAL